MSITYGLRAEYEGTVEQDGAEVPLFLGGVLAIGGDQPFDVGEALASGGGRFTVAEEDGALITALDEYPALKRLSADEALESDAVISSYDAMNVTDLRGEAKRRGLEGYGRASKDALRHALLEHDERRAAGDQAINDPDTTIEGDTIVAPSDPDDAGPAGQEA